MKSVFRRVGCIDVVGSVVCCVFVASCVCQTKIMFRFVQY